MTGSSNNKMGQGVTSGVRGDGGKHTVHWFRKGLRLHDNPSLKEGLAGASTFRCVFVLDPWFAGSTNVGINKWRWATAMTRGIAEARSIQRVLNPLENGIAQRDASAPQTRRSSPLLIKWSKSPFVFPINFRFILFYLPLCSISCFSKSVGINVRKLFRCFALK